MRILWVAGLVVLLASLWFGFGRAGTTALTYDTVVVDRGVVEKTVSTSGSVAALVTVDVGSQISGQILQLNADFNSKVKKGDLLAVLDPQTYKSRVRSAEADLAVARANVGTQQASLKKAHTSLEQSQRDLKRQQTLADAKLIAVNAMEDTRKVTELAASDLEIAKAQLTNTQAAVQTRQSALDQARIDLSRTEIRAPIDGVVISRSISMGQTVAASLQAPTLFSIAQDLARIQIEAKVDEADIGTIKEGNQASFTVDAFPDQTFRGRVAQVRLASANVQNVVTYSVMVQADNPSEILLPGMTANVRIVTDRRENVLRVPNDATRFQPAGAQAGARTAARTTGGGQGGGGRGAGGDMSAEMTQELGLSKEQEEQLKKARDEMSAQARQSAGAQTGGGLAGGGGFNPFSGAQAQQAMRARMENMMRGVLTPEQMQKWQAMRNARGGGGTRAGTLYTLETKTPKQHAVRIGLSDDRFTEIVQGDLKEGDKVVVRARAEPKK
ncbi:MAG: efflux RND transporter periplasmic adaptor subunit [Steroidobacteraceae bacterium]